MFGLKRELITKTVSIEGLHCGGCAKRVQNAFLALKQVKDVTASFEEKQAKLTLKKPMTDDEIKAVIEDLGFSVTEIK